MMSTGQRLRERRVKIDSWVTPRGRLAIALEQHSEVVHYPRICPHCGAHFNPEGDNHLLDLGLGGIQCCECAGSVKERGACEQD